MKKYVDGILVDATEEDIVQYNNDQSNAPTQLQIELNNLRDKRNSLLTQTDWWGASDNTMTDAQKKYRQDLRDLPSTQNPTVTGSALGNVTWPTKP